MPLTAAFVGAGASKAFDFLLTRELLPTILAQLDTGKLFERFPGGNAALPRLRHALRTVFPGLDQVRDNPPLITEILSLIDYALGAHTVIAPGCDLDRLLELRVLLERSIASVLDKPHGWSPPPLLSRMGDWILGQGLQGQKVTGVISTNYDTALERVLFPRIGHAQVPEAVDFGFAWRDPLAAVETDHGLLYPRPAAPQLRLYKLHGSFNSLRCELCEHTYINIGFDLTWLMFGKRPTTANSCHCGHAPLRSTIVAPSLVRSVKDVSLLETWKNALELLRRAEEWIIIGYSFPGEDLAIRSLFLRALNGRHEPPKIRIIQKGLDPELRARYQLFFPDCRYDTGGIKGFLAEMVPERPKKRLRMSRELRHALKHPWTMHAH